MPKFRFTKSLIILFLVGTACLFSTQSTFGQTIIFEMDFDSRQAGPYTDADLDEDFDEPRFNNGVTEGRVRVVQGADAFGGTGAALAASYPAGVHGTRETGAQWPYDFDRSYEEATLSYRVRFAPGFDFVRGGKLPGLAGGTAPTGSTQATGFNGWAGRLMWRTDFNGVSGQPQQLTSGGITYAKYTDSGFAQDGVQEDRNFFFNPDGSRTVFVDDQWYQITQRIVMNTPGEFNGIQQVWVDGVLVINERDLRYRLDDSFAIDQMYFSTFYGGNEDWRTSKAEEAYFDDFVITIPDGDGGDGGDVGGGGGDGDGGFDGPLLVPGQFGSLAAAINAASDGDTILLTENVTEQVVVNKSIMIEGVDGPRILGTNNAKAVVTIDAENVTVKGLELRGGKHGVKVEENSTNVALDDLFVRDSANVGVLVEADCSGFTLLNSGIRFSGNDGVRIFSDQVVLENNNSQRNAGSGFRLLETDTASFTDNISFQNNLHGYRLEGSNFTFIDNLAIENRLRGFAVEGASHRFFNDLARDNGSHGFSLDDTTDGIFFDNRSRFNGGHGYRVQTSAGNLLDDLNSTGNAGHGIAVLMSLDNTIVNSFVFENEGRGILLNFSALDNSVSGNVIRENLGAGISNFGDNNIGDNISRGNLDD